MFFTRSPKPDRRRHQRQLLNTSVRVFTESGPIEALGINVSDVGMCLFTIANLPPGSQIEVEFLPLRRTRATRVLATVRHRAFYLYGIEFQEVSERNLNRDDDRAKSPHEIEISATKR